MAKTKIEASDTPNLALVINGTIVMLLSPFIPPLAAIYQESHCPKDGGGQCTLSSGITMGMLDVFLQWVVFAAGFGLIIFSIIQARRK